MTTNSTITARPSSTHSICAFPHSPLRLPRSRPALSKRNGGPLAMIERPDVDRLLAGPLGAWLEKQVQVREEARRTSDRRYAIGAAIVLPLLAAFWLLLDPDW